MGPAHYRLMNRDRGSLLVLAGVLALVVVSAGAIRFLLVDHGLGADWVRVGELRDVRARGVVSLSDVHAYVVADATRKPITLLARSPQNGEQVVYCPSSTWFEDPAHGSKFDHLGRYVFGPAPRGLARLATLVQDGVVWVDPHQITLGAPRGSHQFRPAGPFCVGGG